MENQYFVGFASGTSKKTQNPWYALRILGENQFGNLDIIPIFLSDEKEFERLKKVAPAFGSAVSVTLNSFGRVVEFKAIDNVPKLNFQ